MTRASEAGVLEQERTGLNKRDDGDARGVGGCAGLVILKESWGHARLVKLNHTCRLQRLHQISQTISRTDCGLTYEGKALGDDGFYTGP